MTKKSKSKPPTNQLQPWYQHVPKHLIPQIPNPAFSQHKVQLPCRIVCVAYSGGGKTQLVVETIYRMPNTFSHVVICCQSADEPLYQYLKSKLPTEQLTICEKIENIPDLEELNRDPGAHTLVVMDDMVHEKKQNRIEEYFIRCRKIPASIMYCSQSYYAIPKLIRQNCTHIWLRKMSGIKDMKLILSDFNVGMEREQLWSMYNDCVADNTFLNIRVCENDLQERFYKGFLEPLKWSLDTTINDDHEERYESGQEEDLDDIEKEYLPAKISRSKTHRR